MCAAMSGMASLKITPHGSTSTMSPALFEGEARTESFIQALAATTDALPPMPATTIGTPVQKCGHGFIRRHPKM